MGWIPTIPKCYCRFIIILSLSHITGWWFATGILFHILGLSWSQVTNSIIFQRGGLKPPSRYFSSTFSANCASTFSANSAHIFEDFSNIFRFFPAHVFQFVELFPHMCKKPFVSNFPILTYVCWTVGVSILKRDTYFPILRIHGPPTDTKNSINLNVTVLSFEIGLFSSSEHWLAFIDYVPWTWSKGKFSRKRWEQSGFSKANVFPVYSHPAVKHPHCMVPNVWFHPF